MKRTGWFKKYFYPFRGSRGIALLMVLWVITILSVIVLEFCFAMRTEVQITQNLQEELQLYAMAEGGIQRAALELIYRHDPQIQQKRKPSALEEIPAELKEWVTDGREYPLAYERGICTMRVSGEAGRININSVSEAVLRKIMTNLGLQGEDKDVVVDSILDWRDPDDLFRVNGAENDYYHSLKEPYDCKNGNLDSVEELLLVRGITPELFYGRRAFSTGNAGPEKRVEQIGLKDIFSIYAQGEQIDINSASLPVLRVFLGIPLEVAQRMIKAREEKGFEHQQDLLTRVPELAPLLGEIGRFILFRATIPFYTIESRARVQEKGGARGIKAVVKIDPKEKEGYKIVQWVDAIY
jgi:general secretion pathway protein K